MCPRHVHTDPLIFSHVFFDVFDPSFSHTVAGIGHFALFFLASTYIVMIRYFCTTTNSMSMLLIFPLYILSLRLLITGSEVGFL